MTRCRIEENGFLPCISSFADEIDDIFYAEPQFSSVIFARDNAILAALSSCHQLSLSQYKHGDNDVHLKSSDAFLLAFCYDEIVLLSAITKVHHGQCRYKVEFPKGRGAINVKNSGKQKNSCLFTCLIGTYDRLTDR